MTQSEKLFNSGTEKSGSACLLDHKMHMYPDLVFLSPLESSSALASFFKVNDIEHKAVCPIPMQRFFLGSRQSRFFFVPIQKHQVIFTCPLSKGLRKVQSFHSLFIWIQYITAVCPIFIKARYKQPAIFK